MGYRSNEIRRRRLCTVEGCNDKHFGKGYCNKHYRRLRDHGHLGDRRRKRGSGSITSKGRILIHTGNEFVFEHILIAEKSLGKKLPEKAEIHHLDGNPSNNESINLVICPSHSYHMLLHRRTRALKACGYVDWERCRYCSKYDNPINMYKSKGG